MALELGRHPFEPGYLRCTKNLNAGNGAGDTVQIKESALTHIHTWVPTHRYY